MFQLIRPPGDLLADDLFAGLACAVAAPNGDMLLIEQRNGPLAETPKELARYRLERAHRATAEIEAAFAAFRAARPEGKRQKKLKLDYLFCCPEHALALSEDERGKPAWRRVADRAGQRDLAARVLDLLKPGKVQPQQAEVAEFLRHSLRLVPEVGNYLAAQEITYLRLTGDLAATLEKLEGAPLRLRVAGTAGCGKSQLALHFYQKAVAAGLRPLLLCYNRPLRDRLRLLASPGGVVETFYGWCHRFLESRGEAVEFPSRARDYPPLWEKLLGRLAELPVPEDARFDWLIVDEGQDFEAGWYALLQPFLKPQGNLLWLDDPLQNLRQQPDFVPPGCVTFRVGANYRSPRRIAEFMQKTLDLDFTCANPLPGLGVGVSRYRYPQEQVETVRGILRQLLEQGFDYRDIVILTCQGLHRSVFFRLDELGGASLRKFTGHYDAGGNQVFSEGELYFDSVYRFKGGQAPAVILVDVNPDPERLAHEKKVLWCGMSRATVRLELAVQEDNPFVARQMRRCALP